MSDRIVRYATAVLVGSVSLISGVLYLRTVYLTLHVLTLV
jgi:hypothetical protein